MNKQLTNALKELKNVKAKNIPGIKEVEKAKNGNSWSGNLTEKGTWKLIKHDEDSYTTNTKINN